MLLLLLNNCIKYNTFESCIGGNENLYRKTKKELLKKCVELNEKHGGEMSPLSLH